MASHTKGDKHDIYKNNSHLRGCHVCPWLSVECVMMFALMLDMLSPLLIIMAACAVMSILSLKEYA